jgi:ParB/RepB/Spo0J family partition protein
MNAPDPVTFYQLLSREQLAPSLSQVQARRRARFDQTALQQLAETIASAGIIEPIIVRLGRNLPAPAEYEIVAGERRWLAAGIAGLDTVPVLVREMNDAEMLKLQLVENLQREGLHPLEEAEGFRELMALEKLNAEAVGHLVGQSRSYVYARVKLLELIPEAQAAMAEGKIDASRALLIARFPTIKLQTLATERMLQYPDRSYRDTVTDLRDKLLTRLNEAHFDIHNAAPFQGVDFKSKDRLANPYAGSCTSCPHNSANDPELQAAIDASRNTYRKQPPGAAMCTNGKCFELKTAAHAAQVVARAEAEGRTVLRGDEAIRSCPSQGYARSEVNNGYLDLGTESNEEFPEPEPADVDDDEGDENSAWAAWSERQDAWQRPTWRDLICGVDGWQDQVIIALHPKDNTVHELLQLQVAKRVLKAAGKKLPTVLMVHEVAEARPAVSEADKAAAERERERERAKQARREAIERTYRLQLFTLIFTKWGKATLKQTDLALIADDLWDNLWVEDKALMREAFGEVKFDAMKEPELHRAIAMMLCAHDVNADSIHQKPSQLLAYAQRLRIDVKKVRTTVTAEIAAAEKAGATNEAAA